MNKKIRTRVAPSPTGIIHIGNLRTALYNYLFAQQSGGEFLLRIEDTDRERFVEGATEKVFAILKWAGLVWKNKKPIVQSERLEIYQKYARQLVGEDKAYYCFCTPELLAKMREEQQEKKLPPKYDRRCRELSETEIKQKLNRNLPYVIRLKVPENEVVEFNDLVYGKIKYNSSEIDDQVLIKSDGFPTYHLAVVIDDHEMEITHVMRGEDWLPSTPKHVLLYKAFNWEMPEFIHLPNILGENKKKLSKRTGDVSAESFKEWGYLPEALINYLALLGWNPGTEQEIFSLQELIKSFDIKKIHKAGAIFDIKKLDNINGIYIRKLKVKKLESLCRPYLEKVYDLKKFDDKYIEAVVKLEQERLKKLSDIVENTKLFFVDELDYEAELLVWKKSNKTIIKNNLTIILQKLNEIDDWNKDNLEKEVLDFIVANNLTNGEVLWPLRVALSGQKNSPSPFEIMDVLRKEESIKRIEGALKKL
ncbi:MAG: glutamate--tRNA ligase [Patescibacteria group bacterium]|jgi:glutamyl-tRNA synthetase